MSDISGRTNIDGGADNRDQMLSQLYSLQQPPYTEQPQGSQRKQCPCQFLAICSSLLEIEDVVVVAAIAATDAATLATVIAP